MASTKGFGIGFGVSLLLVAIVILYSCNASSAVTLASQYETYSYTVTVSQYNCYPYQYTYCYNWWYYNYWRWRWFWHRRWYYGYYCRPWYGCGWQSWCTTYTSYSCYYTYTTETRQATRCKSGWTGSLCNVPTCTPACASGLVCVDLNKCACASDGSSSNCQFVPCSPTNNCYPGTCVNGVCKCPPGFSGDNCLSFDHKPSIGTCSVKLYAQATPGSTETLVANADCAAEGLTPSVTWINGPLLNKGQTNLGLTQILPTWAAEYTFPTPMPAKPQGATQFFIKDTPVRLGVYKAEFSIYFPNNTYETINYACSSTTDLNTLPTAATCNNPTTWNSLLGNSVIGHGKAIIVRMKARLGGKKTGDSTYTYSSQTYGFGDQWFNGTQVTVQSMLMFDTIPPSHCVLALAGSRTSENDRINCTVYPIYLDQDIRTNPVMRPLFIGWSDDGSGIKQFHVEVYYMQSDATDQLAPVGTPVTDSVADIDPDRNNYQFTLPRAGVYSIVLTVYDYANNSVTARKIVNYFDRPSYVTTNSPVYITAANASLNYSFITTMPENPRQLILNFTGRFQPDPLYQSTLSKRVRPLPINPNTIDDIYDLQYGQRSINALANQTGIMSYTVRYVVDSYNGGIGAQPPDDNMTAPISGQTAILDLDEPLKDGDTVVIWLNATGSSGDQTNYRLNVVVDTTGPNISTSGSVFMKNGVDQYTSRFNIPAYDKESGISSLRYKIVDKRSPETVFVSETTVYPQTMDAPRRKKRDRVKRAVCSPSDETCYCIRKLSGTQCYSYTLVFNIDNCKIDRYSEYDLILQYRITNGAGLDSNQYDMLLGDIKGVVCRPSISSGAIAGIVIACIIGFLILLLLIAFLILMIVRVNQKKRAIPTRNEFRTMYGDARKRFTMRKADKASDNELYMESAGHVNVAAPQKVKEKNPMQIPMSQLQISDELARGRFAVIRRAYRLTNTTKESVAVKAVKNGSSTKDKQLMKNKIDFMQKLAFNGNLIRFHGYVDDTDGDGPLMVLELCDYPLKNWLNSVKSDVTTDVAENLLNFSLNIAQGVAFLHSHKIIHRRLLVKNVLLKQQAGGLVAKLIGFGPSAEDEDDDAEDADEQSEVSRPLKWLAPEILDSVEVKAKPAYKEKTDVWSYGVTIWEMYSFGAAPYPDIRSADIRMHLKRGYRLKCPQECPPELFTSVVEPCWKEKPNQRPSVSQIISSIQKFRSGMDRPQSGYYGAGDNELYSDGR